MDPKKTRDWQDTFQLRDGTWLHLRPITGLDDDKMQRLFGRLSQKTIYLRFMGVIRRMSSRQIERFTHLDFSNEMAIVATLPDPDEPEGERLVAVGRYVRQDNPGRAEVAFTVEDAYQGQGLGSRLLEALIPFALAQGITTFTAEILVENTRMMEVLRKRGFRLTTNTSRGVVYVEFPIRDGNLPREESFEMSV